MSFSVHKTSDNRAEIKRTKQQSKCLNSRTWTRRIQWLVNSEGQVKLKLEEHHFDYGSLYKEVVTDQTSAKIIWDRYREGQTMGDAVSILATEVTNANASRKAGK